MKLESPKTIHGLSHTRTVRIGRNSNLPLKLVGITLILPGPGVTLMYFSCSKPKSIFTWLTVRHGLGMKGEQDMDGLVHLHLHQSSGMACVLIAAFRSLVTLVRKMQDIVVTSACTLTVVVDSMMKLVTTTL